MLSKFKEQAFQALKCKNIPTKKQEEWRYSDLSLLEDISNDNIKHTIPFISDEKSYFLVITNGKIDKSRSNLPNQGIILFNNKDHICSDLLSKFNSQECFDNKYHVLQNYSRTQSSLLIDITGSLNKPLKIYYLNNSSCYCTTFIKIRSNIHIKLYEEFFCKADHVNQITKIELDDDASCKHLKKHHIKNHTKLLYSNQIICKTNATYYSYVLNTGYNSYRQDTECQLQGTRSSCNFYGINIGKEQQKYDIILKVIHQNSYTSSKQHYNQILADKSQGSFYSKVQIPSLLEKIEAHQLNKNLLLDETAKSFTRPELDIFSDDVICSHGATVGSIDEDALYYLQSRGIDQLQAKKLIAQGFLRSVFEDNGLDKEDYKTLNNQITDYLK